MKGTNSAKHDFAASSAQYFDSGANFMHEWAPSLGMIFKHLQITYDFRNRVSTRGSKIEHVFPRPIYNQWPIVTRRQIWRGRQSSRRGDRQGGSKSMRRLFGFVFLSALLMLSACVGSPTRVGNGNSTYSVSGIIEDEDGNPLEGVI